jgi:starch synthase (maltosyl-transferring)
MRVGEFQGRVIIEGVTPEIDQGRFPIKRTFGEKVVVEADIFAEGHDVLSGVLRYRHEADEHWSETPLEFLVNDRWRAEFGVTQLGRYRYTLEAWVDRFKTWRRDLSKKVEAGQDVTIDLLVGVKFIEEAKGRALGPDAKNLGECASALRSDKPEDQSARVRLALSQELAQVMALYPDRRLATRYGKELQVVVDRERARFSTWYEMFPRSCAPKPGVHGTFKDCKQRLPSPAHPSHRPHAPQGKKQLADRWPQ